MRFQELTKTPTLVDNWPYGFQYIQTGTDGTLDITGTYDLTGTEDLDGDGITHYGYLSAFALQHEEIDRTINNLYDNYYIETAAGRELEKLAAPVDVGRQEGESDDDLRYRAALNKASSASNGNAEDIDTILKIAFPGKDVSQIDVRPAGGKPVINFEVPSSYLDDIPLTKGELETQLEKAFPCGHGVQVVTSDTFILGESGSQGLGNGKLT